MKGTKSIVSRLNIHKNSEARKSLKNIKDSQSWGFAGGRCGQWGPECGSVVRDKVERFPNKCFGVWTLRKVIIEMLMSTNIQSCPDYLNI